MCMKEKEQLYVSVDGWFFKIYKTMKFIKNILLVTYIKNKGLRRLAFIISCAAVIYCLSMLFSNIHPTDIMYKNLSAMQTDVRIFYETKAPYWYKKQECAEVYLERMGLDNMSAIGFLVSKDISTYCDSYPKYCHLLLAIEDEPVHLKCRGWGNEHKNPFRNICEIILFLAIVFYLPFIGICILKLSANLLKWIFKGFRES